MIVSSGQGLCFERGGHKAILSRNGTFIDLYYEQDGVRKWMAFSPNDLEIILGMSNHGDSLECFIEFDEADNIETALLSFLVSPHVKEFAKKAV